MAKASKLSNEGPSIANFVVKAHDIYNFDTVMATVLYNHMVHFRDRNNTQLMYDIELYEEYPFGQTWTGAGYTTEKAAIHDITDWLMGELLWTLRRLSEHKDLRYNILDNLFDKLYQDMSVQEYQDGDESDEPIIFVVSGRSVKDATAMQSPEAIHVTNISEADQFYIEARMSRGLHLLAEVFQRLWI